MSKQFELT